MVALCTTTAILGLLVHKNNFTFETTINNLPNGTYRFKFQLYNCNLNNGSDKI